MDPVVLFIIIFVVAPIIERLLKGRQQQQPPSQQRPRERPLPRPRPEPSRDPAPYREQSDPLPHAEQRGEPTPAADMLPDDLWEILTGQRRDRPPQQSPTERAPAPVSAEQRTEKPLPQPRRPRPGIVRKPLPSAEHDRIGRMQKPPERRPDAGPGELTEDEESRIPQEAKREQYPVEGYIREIPIHKAPEVVSLEEVDLDEERRHTRFHQRVAGMAAPARVQRARAHKISVLFRQRTELRRAVLLREVLGLPKSLE